jgi:hypothetical protein
MAKLSVRHVKLSSKKRLNNKTLSSSRFSKPQLAIFVAVFAFIGGYIIFSTFAAGPVLSFEAESGTVTAPASAIDDSGASGSKAVHFGAALACAVNSPNVADGRDPFGGCYPGASNTGVPTGTVLTNYTGPCIITAANTVIDSKTVDCYLEIQAKNVQIRNSLINGHVWIDDPTPDYSFTITDSTVDAGPVDATHNDGNKALGKSHFVATRVETVRGISGVFCEYDCTIQDSWIHGQDFDEGGHAHESGIRLGSACGATLSGCSGDNLYPHILGVQNVIHDSITCDAADNPPDAGCSADISAYGDFAPIQNNNIKRNLLLTTTGGTCAYGGSGGGSKPYDLNAHNNIWQDNIFQRGAGNRGAGPLGHCGFWFAISGYVYNPPSGAQITQPGSQWTNNKWDTGEQMPNDG